MTDSRFANPDATRSDPLARYRLVLDDLAQRHRRRALRSVEHGGGPRLVYNGRSLINFGSNNYLGLAEHPRVIDAATQAMARQGAGSGASRLVSGHSPGHDRLESALAQLKNTEQALVFGSGYLANIGTISALVGRGDVILADRAIHASLVDGCRLSGATLKIYRRDRLDRLETLLARRRSGLTLLVTEGVFSMEGDLAPLPDLVELAERYDALLMVDDAHATGVFGARGAGSSEHWGLGRQRVSVQMGTLSKALGGLGGFVCGSHVLIDYLIQRARTFVYTTALPAGVVAAAAEALRVLEEEPDRRRRLWANRALWHNGVTAMGFDTFGSASPIISLRIGDDDRAVRMSAALADEGVYAPAIRPPTVPAGSARLRTSVLATHTPEDLAEALAALHRVASRLGIL